jgi:hypothetical protein
MQLWPFLQKHIVSFKNTVARVAYRATVIDRTTPFELESICLEGNSSYSRPVRCRPSVADTVRQSDGDPTEREAPDYQRRKSTRAAPVDYSLTRFDISVYWIR